MITVKEFNEASATERAWLQESCHAANLTFEWPTLIIHTDNPPAPLPLTAACVTARFVPASHVWRSRVVNYGLSNLRILGPTTS